MTEKVSTTQSEIDELTIRHLSIKQKWLRKKQEIVKVLKPTEPDESAKKEDGTQTNRHYDCQSKSDDYLSFEEQLVDFLHVNTPAIPISTLAQFFSKDTREIENHLKELCEKYSNDTKLKKQCETLLSEESRSINLTLTDNSPSQQSPSSPTKHSIPSWMDLPMRRGAVNARDRPSSQLLQVLSTPSARESEKEALNKEMDRLLNEQTTMEKLLTSKFQTKDSIQEYCQHTTREDCSVAHESSFRHSRSSSASSDEKYYTNDSDFQLRKKRKHDGNNELSDPKEFNRTSSSYFHRRNIRNSYSCGKVHFRRLLKAHTDESLGDCSFLNTCFHMDTCKYIHYQIDKTGFSSGNSYDLSTKSIRNASIVERISPGSLPAQWVRCDLRQFDMSVLGKFSVIMADPPWDIHMELPYGTMADEEMRRLDIPSLQDDGYIFLWVTGRAMELGRECLRIWGYRRCDEIIWVKTNQLQRIIRTGRTGHWLNHGKEHCLVGVKGSPKGPNRGLDCDVIVAEVRATSRKPDEIYGMIERLLPRTRKVELFGRPHNVQPNWITLGNQLDGIRLIEPDVVRRFRQRYPNGYTMNVSNQQQSQTEAKNQ